MDRRALTRSSIAALGVWFTVLQVVKACYMVAAVLILTVLDQVLLYGGASLIFVGMQLQFLLGIRASIAGALQQVSAGRTHIDYLATTDAAGIEIGLEDYRTRILWTGFSGHFTSRNHLVLYRGGCPSISIPTKDMSSLFLAGVSHRLSEAEVPEIKPPNHRLLILGYGFGTALLLGVFLLIR